MRARRLLQAAAVAGTISAAAIPETRHGQNLLKPPPPNTQPEAETHSASFLPLPIEGLLSGAKSLFEDILNNAGGEPRTACYCSGGVTCCEDAGRPVCSYGTCGI